MFALKRSASARVLGVMVLASVGLVAGPPSGTSSGVPFALHAGGQPIRAGSVSSGPDAGMTGGEWTSIRSQIRRAQYNLTWQTMAGMAPAYRAPNRAQGFDVAMSPSGFSARGAGWHFGLRLTGYGDRMMPAGVARDDLIAEKDTGIYRWSESVREWYRNDPEGVEHGLVLAAPPPGDSAEVRLVFALDTNLESALTADGQALSLRGPAVSLRYDQLIVTDASGRRLPSYMELPSSTEVRIVADAAGARYPLAVDPLLHAEVAILHASDMQAYDTFGYSVGVSGDTLVVGAYFENGGPGDPVYHAGAAYVFTRNQGGADGWGQMQILHASDMQASDTFGCSVGISGDTVVVGAYGEKGGPGDPAAGAGAAYVFARNQGGADSWGQVRILHASDSQASDCFGYAVGVSGDVAIVGALLEDGGAGNPASNAGAAYVFVRNQGGADNWGQVKILHASDLQAGDGFGGAVGISGDTLVVGASWEDGGAGNPASNSGAAYVFARNQSGADNWGQVRVLHASDRQVDDYFGYSVGISGDTVVVGALWEDGGTGNPAIDAGAAYVFARNQGGADVWGQVRILRASDLRADDRFGQSVSVSGDAVVVGAWGEDGGSGNPASGAGAAYVFTRNRGGADAWGEAQILHASDLRTGDNLGGAVSISGDTLVVGSPLEDGGAGDPVADAGAAYTFVLDDGIWSELKAVRASDPGAGDFLGSAISVSDDVLVVGAYGEDGGAGNLAIDAGAAYVFSRNHGGADGWGQVQVLRASDMQAGDYFGYSVDVSGDLLVVGAPDEDGGAGDPAGNAGAAYVFARNQGGADNWGQVRILRASDRQAGDNFGYAASISGDTLIVGAVLGGLGGAANVFDRNQGGADNWGERKILYPWDLWPDQDLFGSAVDISGDTLVVGASGEDGGISNDIEDAGAAYVFSRNQGGADNWGGVQVLRASDLQAMDNFGAAVSISGDTLVVGAIWENGGADDPVMRAGAAYVYSRNHGGPDQWGEVQVLHASDLQEFDYFGWSVSVGGDIAVIGSVLEDGGPGDPASNAGSAYVFARNQGGADNWGETKIMRAMDMQANDYFGWSVSVSRGTAAIGAYKEDGGVGDPAGDAGSAYLFVLREPPIGLPAITAADADACADTGVTITWTADPADWGDGGSGARTYAILRDGSAIASEIAYGTTHYTDLTGANGQPYSYTVRYINGEGGNADTAGAPAADDDATPGGPSILGITDGDACKQSGLIIAFSGGSGASSHDLWVDDVRVAAGIASPYPYDPGNAAIHSYVVRAITGSCSAGSIALDFADADATPPPVGLLFMQPMGAYLLIWWEQLMDPARVDYYEVVRGLAPEGPFNQRVGTASGSLNGLIVNLSAEPANAYYKVRAVKGACLGPLD